MYEFISWNELMNVFLWGWPVPKWSYISAHVRARFGLRVMETKWWSEPGETPRKSDLVLSSHIADQVLSGQTKHNLIIVELWMLGWCAHLYH